MTFRLNGVLLQMEVVWAWDFEVCKREDLARQEGGLVCLGGYLTGQKLFQDKKLSCLRKVVYRINFLFFTICLFLNFAVLLPLQLLDR